MKGKSTSSPARSGRMWFLRVLLVKGWRWITAVLAILLVWVALRDTDWQNIRHLLARLDSTAIAILLLVNVVMLPLMTGRWWLLLRMLKSPVSLATASMYRLAGNSVSYLTPGPHFGGEPLLVYLLKRCHGHDIPTATVSVLVDRMLELFATMVVLLICLVSFSRYDFPILRNRTTIVLSLSLLILLGTLLYALFSGRRPLSLMISVVQKITGQTFPTRNRPENSLAAGLISAETAVESLYREQPFSLLAASAFSAGQWLGIFSEFWIMAALLGFELSLTQLCGLVAVARLAFYTPLPAGLGALELALPYVTGAFGLGSMLGMTLCLIIRLRDTTLSLLGLGVAMKYLTCTEKISIVSDKQLK